MYSFLISLVALVLGYLLYGRFVERVFGVDSSRKTPAVTSADGVDFVPMPAWKVYMVQFLNIAGAVHDCFTGKFRRGHKLQAK